MYIYTLGQIVFTTLTSYIYMTIPLYIECNTYICTILFGLLDLSNITLIKDFMRIPGEN